jgi:hypothetical protein
MSKTEILWDLLTIIATGYLMVMVGVTVFFTGWLVKEWFWPSPDFPERIERMIQKDVEEISLASWQEKKDLHI